MKHKYNFLILFVLAFAFSFVSARSADAVTSKALLSCGRNIRAQCTYFFTLDGNRISDIRSISCEGGQSGARSGQETETEERPNDVTFDCTVTNTRTGAVGQQAKNNQLCCPASWWITPQSIDPDPGPPPSVSDNEALFGFTYDEPVALLLTVFDRIKNIGINDAQVAVYRMENHTITERGTTDAKGMVAFNLQPNSYYTRVAKQGYDESESQEFMMLRNGDTSIALVKSAKPTFFQWLAIIMLALALGFFIGKIVVRRKP